MQRWRLKREQRFKSFEYVSIMFMTAADNQ